MAPWGSYSNRYYYNHPWVKKPNWTQAPHYGAPAQQQQTQERPPSWYCTHCGTPHHDAARSTCRSCASQRLAPQKGQAQQTQAPKQKANQRVEGGITQADLDLVCKLERRIQLDTEATWPALPQQQIGTAPSTEQLAQVSMLRANLQALKALPQDTQDPALIQQLQSKLDVAIGMPRTQSGGEREGAKLHKMLGALKTQHATELDTSAKEQMAAEAALEAAQQRLKAAKDAQEALTTTFERRQQRLTTLIQAVAEKEDTAIDDGQITPTQVLSGSTVPISPGDLSPFLSTMLDNVREEHGLMGTETPELQAVQRFCTVLIDHLNLQTMQNAPTQGPTPPTGQTPVEPQHIAVPGELDMDTDGQNFPPGW
jgi:hypothetical protein